MFFNSAQEALAAYPRGWPWEHFLPHEIACKGDGTLMVVPAFMERMSELRGRSGRAIIVKSWYRSPWYNDKVSTTGLDGPHTTGRAVDVLVFGGDALELFILAHEVGFTGFGAKQKGPAGQRFLHLDDVAAKPSGPRPWIWTY